MTDLPAEVEFRRVRLPLVTPHVTWRTTLDEREVILVRVQLGDGREGWGECPTFPAPDYTSEYTDAAWAVLRDIVVPPLVRFPDDPWRHLHLVGHPMATGAVRDAIDAACATDRSMAQEHAGPGGFEVSATVPTTAVLSGWDDLDDLLARAARAVDSGASALKVKLARDLDPVWALRSTFPQVLLAADVNGLYDVEGDDDELLAEIDKLGLLYLEQPHQASHGWASLLNLRGRLDTPIALDESITDLASAQAALMLGAASILNIKPARVGGGDVAVEILTACVEAGAGAFVGGMLETGVGRAHALAVASLSGCTLPTDLGPSSRYFAEDLTEPFELNPDGTLTVPTGPGLGRVPDPDRLEAATVDRLVLRR